MGHLINANRGGFADQSASNFLALFFQSSIPDNFGVASKVTTLGNRGYFFLRGSFTPSTISI